MNNDISKMLMLMAELDRMNIPIIFKGAMVLKVAINQSGANPDTERATTDIDGDWYMNPPSMDELEQYISQALYKIDKTMRVERHREYGAGKSAGFNIVQMNGDKAFSMDVSMKQHRFMQRYSLEMNNIQFNGASIDKMMADKLRGVSKRVVFRRIKDVYDLYLLSFMCGYNTYKVWEIIIQTGGVESLGTFGELKKNVKELKHAYEKMRRITNKPDFNILYPRVLHFIEPFMADYKARNLVWDGNNWV